MLTLIDKARHTMCMLLKACNNIIHCNRQAHLHKAISPKDIGFFLFLFSKFRHCYLSLQSPVSSFPHGSCLLLVSNVYSALDEIYHPLYAPTPRNMTLRRHTVYWKLQMTHRTVTLVNALFQGLIAAPQSVIYLNPTIQTILEFQIEHDLVHSPLLKESLWVSHSQPTYMLKFSGLAGLSSCFARNEQGVRYTHTHQKVRHSKLCKHIKSIAYEWHTYMLPIANVKSKTALTCRTCKSSAWLCHDSSLMPRNRHWNRHTFRNSPKAQCTFKILLIHESLLLSMLITLCCTLHHHPSQDIQCWK